MRENVLRTKSFNFALRIVNLYKFLKEEKKEFIMSKQIMRSGTSVGAMIREAEHGESKKDFVHKNSIAQKEINETLYWLELLYASNFISQQQYESLHTDAIEIVKLVTSTIKTAKKDINHLSFNINH